MHNGETSNFLEKYRGHDDPAVYGHYNFAACIQKFQVPVFLAPPWSGVG